MRGKFSRYKAVLVGVLVLVGIIFTSGCVSKSPPQPLTLKPELLKPMKAPPAGTSAQFIACSIFGLGKELGYSISTDNEAFDILKEYWYLCEDVGAGIEDCIPSDMTGDEAIQRRPPNTPYLEYKSITLENNQTVDAWVLNSNYAVDEKGNVYGCVSY